MSETGISWGAVDGGEGRGFVLQADLGEVGLSCFLKPSAVADALNPDSQVGHSFRTGIAAFLPMLGFTDEQIAGMSVDVCAAMVDFVHKEGAHLKVVGEPGPEPPPAAVAAAEAHTEINVCFIALKNSMDVWVRDHTQFHLMEFAMLAQTTLAAVVSLFRREGSEGLPTLRRALHGLAKAAEL